MIDKILTVLLVVVFVAILGVVSAAVIETISDSNPNPSQTEIEESRAPEDYCQDSKIEKVLVNEDGEAYAVVCK